MKALRNPSYLILILLLLFKCQPAREYPTDVEFESHIMRSGEKGDNWCMTIGEDSALYTAQCDGRGWFDENGDKRDFKNTHIWKITGGPDAGSFKPEMITFPDYSRTGLMEIYGPIVPPDALTEFVPPNKHRDGWNWYGYGLVSVDGSLYQFISHCADRWGWGWFDGTQLIHRPKGQENWLRWNGSDAHDRDRWLINEGGNQLMFFDEPNYAFSFITVAQYGIDYKENKDGYVYLYSPEGTFNAANLNMARVKKEHIIDRAEWEYFVGLKGDGDAEWAKDDISKRGIVHQFPEGWGFYSWSPSVVWNEKLNLFIMVTGGAQRPGTGEVLANGPHNESGSLMFLYGEKPWGPWHQFYYKENWQVGEDINRLYLPQLSPKWISDDGTEMYIVFSDAANGHSTYYMWNMQKVKIVMGKEQD